MLAQPIYSHSDDTNLPWEFIIYSGHQGVHTNAKCFFPCVELCAPVPESIRIELEKPGSCLVFVGDYFIFPHFHSTCVQQPHCSLISSSKGSEILFLESQKGVGIVYLVGSLGTLFPELRTWSP